MRAPNATGGNAPVVEDVKRDPLSVWPGSSPPQRGARAAR